MNSDKTETRIANLTPFQPGQSGNPAGRPAGSRNIKTILRELLDVAAQVKDNDGNLHEVTQLDVICAKLVNMAKEGDLASIDRVFDRLEGKAAQSVDMTSKGNEVKGVTIMVGKAEDKDVLESI